MHRVSKTKIDELANKENKVNTESSWFLSQVRR